MAWQLNRLQTPIYQEREELTAPPKPAATFITSIISSSKMPPRRSVRSKGPAYKKGDYIEVSTKVQSGRCRFGG